MKGVHSYKSFCHNIVPPTTLLVLIFTQYVTRLIFGNISHCSVCNTDIVTSNNMRKYCDKSTDKYYNISISLFIAQDFFLLHLSLYQQSVLIDRPSILFSNLGVTNSMYIILLYSLLLVDYNLHYYEIHFIYFLQAHF